MADLPIANISRIMKNALPDNAKIAKDAKECVQECVTEFIAFITSEGICLFILSSMLYSLSTDGPCLFLLWILVYCCGFALPHLPMFPFDLLSLLLDVLYYSYHPSIHT